MTSGNSGAVKQVPLKGLMKANIPSPGYAVHPLIPRSQVTLMGGHGGSGKSLIGLTIAAHVADGKHWGPFKVRKGSVLVVSMEDTADILRDRLKRIIKFYSLDPKRIEKNLLLLDCTELDALVVEHFAQGRRHLRLVEDAERIMKEASKYDLVLIDNASDAYAADENVRYLVRSFIRALSKAVRPSDGAVLLLTHIDKTAARTGSGGQTYSGSTAWHNSVRSRIAITEGQLKHEKHQFGPRHPDVTIEFNQLGLPVLVDETAIKARQRQQLEDDKKMVLALMVDAEQAGVLLPTSTKGPNNIWKQITSLPAFPSTWEKAIDGKARLTRALSSLEAEEKIQRERYTNNQRNKREKWVLADSSVKE